MARRSRGDGSVYFDAGRGCWRGSVDIGRNPQTGRRVRRKVSAATRTECREKVDQLREEYRKTGTVAPRNVTVEHVVRDLLANPPADWKSPVTVLGNTRHAEAIIAAIGNVKLVRLTPGDVERRLLAPMAAAGLATGTISGRKSVLSMAIRRAERDNLVSRNVARLAETPHGTRRDSKSLTLQQVRALFASDLDAWWRGYLLCGILLGLRPGELLGLRWEDVDHAAGVIRVRRSVKAVPQEPGADGRRRWVLALEDLKTDKSKRTLKLPARVSEALKTLRAAQAADRLRLGPYYGGEYGDLGLVFCTPAGRPMRLDRANARFKKVCAAAGIGSDWTPYEQRHTFASVLSDAGTDIELIADAMGHVNSNVTRTVYRHQIADKVAQAASVMDSIFGSA
jgi:integrase